MEILRFEEAATTAPKRKKSSKSYLAVGFVATIFGLGSAFASNTIEINGNAPIALGQGVILVTACDTEVSVVPVTEMIVENPGGPTFYMKELQISGIDDTATNAVTGLGCGGKTFDVQIYDGSNNPYTCLNLNLPGGDPSAPNDLTVLSCTGAGDDTLSFDVSPKPLVDSNYIITFDNAPSDISYISLVTRQTPPPTE
jgi:hypothetical protein